MLNFFSLYFFCTASIFALNFWRVQLLKLLLYGARAVLQPFTRCRAWADRSLTTAIRNINQQSVVFFAKTDAIDQLNKAILYIRANEVPDHPSFSVSLTRILII